MTKQISPSIPLPADQVKKQYTIGTLTYTTFGLVNLFVWLLWGDFCYIMLELVIPRILPLSLKDLHASNGLIGFIVGSIPAILSITINPIFAVRSDRHRGPRGRRIPYLLWTSPLAAGFLILIGYHRTIAGWLSPESIAHLLNLHPTTVTLALLCLLVVVFQFFNQIMTLSYNSLFADVVPQEVIGRFMAFFRAVGSAAGFVFSRYLFCHVDDYRPEIYAGVGLLYAASFLLMCRQVREGSYPPPETAGVTRNRWRSLCDYFRECFTIPLYLYLFIGMMFINLTSAMSPFFIFFYRDTLGLSMTDIGNYMGWTYLFTTLVYIPIGFFCDRTNKIVLTGIGLTGLLINSVLIFFFVHNWNTLLISGLASTAASACYGVGSATMCITLLPREKYAQFISALNLLGAVGMVLGNYLGGVFMDWAGNYRFVCVWQVGSLLIGLCFIFGVYREWRRHGGATDFQPPTLANAMERPLCRPT